MLLRKLETYGFKSFADKLNIEFGQGITAIVGPNGSGKSNITDAIRWVLGEQNIRNLRGAKFEDIIFSGSASRRALGVAEVSLTLDNSGGLLPLDFREVMITRRIFRSGDSEYYINKAQCRLKDIHQLLADTGLGRDAMTVISQNKIDEVLNSKPEDRRLIFEEAAGITRYKNRKKDALRKLEDTEQNLLRVADITAEIDSQLLPLAESAEKTRRYNQIAAELTACQVTVLLNKLDKYHQFINSAAQQKEALTADRIDLGSRLALQEASKECLVAELAAIEEHVQGTGEKISRLTAELEKNNGQAGILDERIKQASQAKMRIDEDILRLGRQQEEHRMKLNQLQETLAVKQAEDQGLNLELSALSEQDGKLAVEIKTVEQELEKLRAASTGGLQELAGQQNQLLVIERDIELNKERQTSLAQAQAKYREQQEHAQSGYDDAVAELARQQTVIDRLQQAKLLLSDKKRQLELAGEKLGNQHTSLLQQQSEWQSRLKVLSGMQREYEGFGRAMKSVLKTSHQWSHGICGAVAEILQVDNPYVIAIETALGGALQHIITEDADIAKQAIGFLKQNRLGRATFLPLGNIRPAPPREPELAAARADGALGFAAKLVSVDVKYQKVIDFLLGRTIVAADIDSAQRIAGRYAFSVRVVTLEGELLNIGGSVSGGSHNRREASFLSRTSEIEEIRGRLTAITGEITACLEQGRESKQAVDKLNQQLLMNNETRQQLEIRQAELAAHREKFSQEISRLQQMADEMKVQSAACENELLQFSAKLEQAKRSVAALEVRDISQRETAFSLQQRLTQLTAERTGQGHVLTDIRIKVEALRQNVIVLEQSRRDQEEYITGIALQLAQLTTEKKHIAGQASAAASELERLNQEKAELSSTKRHLEEQRDRQYAGKLAKLTEMQNSDREIKELRRKLNDVQARLHEAELLFTKYSYEAANCREILEQHYAMTVEQAMLLKRDDSDAELAGSIHRLEAEVARIGPVNPNAIEEYGRLCERQQFLQQQYADLVAAKECLAAIISDIDQSMSKQFSAAFRQINEYFADIFARLFGGGQARLQLSNPDEPLESGVDIIVQPPGKKLQNLILLSGGERALTVIALLFAFLTYRPAPFSVVDEIDAPLDEANLERFSSFLRDYSRKTQFIVVTHRKGTMEAADVLHGVTIEEAGVSRVISVKLEDKAN